MHVVIFGLLFVAAMISIGQPSFMAGLFTFLLWGVLPVSLIVYLLGRRK